MRTQEQIRQAIEQLRERAREIDNAHQGEFIDPDSDEGREWNAVNEELDRELRTLEQVQTRERRLTEIADDPDRRDDPPPQSDPERTSPAIRTRTEDADIYDLSTVRMSIANPASAAEELRSRAMRSLERSHFVGTSERPVDQDRTKEFVEGHLDPDADSQGVLARYLLATGSPAYKRAFGKYLAGVQLTREESSAMEQAAFAERALSLTGSAGGFAVPYVLDPTLIHTSAGVVNPIRQISNVKSITVDEWRGVSTAGVTAAYEAEATQVADQTPTIAQPTVSTEKAQAWVAASIEINQDWTGLQQEMAGLFAEAKDDLEAVKFASGTGTNEPFGVLVGTTNTVNAAAGADAFTLANLYSLVGSLPPRYRARARFLADLLILNRIRQFETPGGGTSGVWEPGGLGPDNPDRLLGKPVHEASAFPDDATTGNKFLLLGDFSRYVIADRIGMNIEVVPHVFGANQRPTGQRGFYCYWRNGAKAVDANAFRALIGTA